MIQITYTTVQMITQTRSNTATRIHMESYGDGERYVVLLHGWLHSSRRWEHLINALSPHFRVITLDIPGFGLSRPELLENPNIFELLLEPLLERLSHEIHLHSIYSVIGDSLGGLLWLRSIQLGLISCDRMVLSGCPADGFSKYLQWTLPAFSWAGLMSLRVMPYPIQKAIIRIVSGAVLRQRNSAGDSYYQDILRADPVTAFKVVRRISHSLDMRGGYQYPESLIIRGEYDRVCSAQVASKLARVLDAALVGISDSGHTPAMENSSMYTNAVMHFLLDGAHSP